MFKKIWAWLFPQQAIRTLHTGAPEMSQRVNRSFHNYAALPDDPTEPLDDRTYMRDGETLEQWIARMESYK